MSTSRTAFWKKIFKITFLVTGLILFALGNWIFRTFMTNFDERDHIAAGFLMSKNWVLYKDIFSHHFPFPYYWVNFWSFLWVNEAPYRGIALLRTTLNIYYVMCSTLVLINISKFKNKVYFVIFLLSIIILMPLFHGNILLSETFAFYPILMIIWMLFSAFSKDLKINRITAMTSALFVGLGFWSQPLLFPAFLLPLFYLKKEIKTYISTLLLILIIPLVFFTLNGSLANFLKMGLWFNYAIYPQYYQDIEGIKPGFTGIVIKGLQNQFSMMFPSSFGNFISNAQFLGVWIFILTSLILLFKKGYKIFLALTLSFLILRVREVKIIPGYLFNFGILPLMMFFNLLLLSLIYKLRGIIKYILTFIFVVYLFLLGKEFSPILKQSIVSGYNYHVFWSDRQVIGQEIQRMANNQPVLIYPHDVDLYYFSKSSPPDKFLYWFPWINDVDEYRLERESTINKKTASVVYLGDLSFKNQPKYYLKLSPQIIDGYYNATTEGKLNRVYLKR